MSYHQSFVDLKNVCACTLLCSCLVCELYVYICMETHTQTNNMYVGETLTIDFKWTVFPPDWLTSATVASLNIN